MKIVHKSTKKTQLSGVHPTPLLDPEVEDGHQGDSQKVAIPLCVVLEVRPGEGAVEVGATPKTVDAEPVALVLQGLLGAFEPVSLAQDLLDPLDDLGR
jgi:hypothetical protein